VLTVLLLVVWIGSGWISAVYHRPHGRAVGVAVGVIGVIGSFDDDRVVMPIGLEVVSGSFELQWWFHRGNVGGRTETAVPLWLPAVLSLLATAAAWRADAKYIRRARAGLCAGCGYDRAGLAAGSACTECGIAPDARG